MVLSDGSGGSTYPVDPIYDLDWPDLLNFAAFGSSGELLDGEVTVSDGIQEWTVPFTGTYVITCYGAQGSNPTTGNDGGLQLRLAIPRVDYLMPVKPDSVVRLAEKCGDGPRLDTAKNPTARQAGMTARPNIHMLAAVGLGVA